MQKFNTEFPLQEQGRDVIASADPEKFEIWPFFPV
jgi:hypothetical protein